MSIFSTIKYQISNPPTQVELMRIPAITFNTWAVYLHDKVHLVIPPTEEFAAIIMQRVYHTNRPLYDEFYKRLTELVFEIDE